ncbi:MAG: rhodanese-like domain-containing protein [Bacteroidetes bacterium]|nr:rhodanese-like domain-containing protein [Bacteroidota bacterium]
MKTISVTELHNRIQSGEQLHLVDVRESFEHDDFNIGGVLLPLGEIRVGETASIDHLKGEEVILYCRSGNRSGQAALLLESLGFTNTVNVVGGMLAWKEAF